MRPLFPQRLLFCALVWAFSPACSWSIAPRALQSAHPKQAAESSTADLHDASLRDARELARALPRDAERCTVVLPGRVALAERPLLSLVSQVDRLPWALRTQVTAYARAELTPRSDRRRVVELIRFAGGSAAQLRKDLTQHADRKWTWDDEPIQCDDVLTCFAARARFIDARTVRVSTGDWPYEDGSRGGDCLGLLERFPKAIEVSARRGNENPELGNVERWLTKTESGVQRVERRFYADARSAERARLKQVTGYNDLPLMGGVPVQAQFHVEGQTLAQTAHVSWDDLWLVVEDQERLRRMLQGVETPAKVHDDAIEVADAEQVRAHVDARISALEHEEPAGHRESLLSLRELLVRARLVHPLDEGLARRLFSLSMFGLDEPRAALVVAETMIAGGSTQALAWELSLRRALAQVDEIKLRQQLVHAHNVSPAEAAKMASSLARAVRAGQDYERAEWAFLIARTLSQRAHAMRLVSAPALVLSPGLLVRALATLAIAAAEPAHEAIGIHVLIMGSDLATDTTKRDDSLWIQRTEALGVPALALAATSWDAPQVLALAQAIDQLAPSTAEIWVGFDPLQHPARPGTLVRLAMHRDEQGFVLDRLSKNVAHANWSGLVRQVAEPLMRLQGAVFPPDALSIEARNAEELSQYSAAVARVDGVTCNPDGLTLECRGTLHDGPAAERALRAIVRSVLAPEVRIFTSGVE